MRSSYFIFFLETMITCGGFWFCCKQLYSMYNLNFKKKWFIIKIKEIKCVCIFIKKKIRSKVCAILIINDWLSENYFHITIILPRLLQRSKECCGHYSTLYHATSQWIMRSETHLFFWHNVKKSVHLKFKIMSITCRFHVSDMVLT